MAKVTVLGLGAMGSRMAMAALRAGHAVTVWNRSKDKAVPLIAAGAREAATPREAVAGAEFALSMVRDDDAARAVWLDRTDGALAGLAPQAVAIECSTVTPGWARELAEACRSAGRSFLDAPVAGSRPQADAGQLVFLVGGDAEVLARAEPILSAMGAAAHHAGPAGSGAAVKLAVNALLAVQVATLAELLGWIARIGPDPATAAAIIGATAVASPAAKASAEGMLARNFAPLFPIELLRKDLGYLAASARNAATPLPVMEAVAGVFDAAGARGNDQAHVTAVSLLYA